MKLRTIKRLTALLLCVAMLAGVPALATIEDDVLPSAPVGSETEAVVELPEVCEGLPSTGESFGEQVQPMSTTTFNVTVPTTLPIHMDAYGNITCGNIVITNNGTESVVVEDAQLTALNGWTLVDYDTTSFTKANEGQHKVALQLGPWDSAIAANGGQETIEVATKIPYQGAKVINADIAQVVFVLEIVSEASTDWEYTIDGNTITLTKYIGESWDVMVHNKYAVNGKVYKTAMGESDIYYSQAGYHGPFAGSSKQGKLTSIIFEKDIEVPKNMSCMFGDQWDLASVDVGNIDTSNVTDMSGIFGNCSSSGCLSLVDLKGLDKWDTSNVTCMACMFYCPSLTSLDLSSFDTSNATYMYGMFDGCNRLQTVTLGDKFSFNGATATRLINLPTPDPAYIPGADGYWYTADGTRYAPSEIPNNTAATYYAVKPAPCDHAYGAWDDSNYPYWVRTCLKCGSVQTIEASSGLCELRFQLETNSGTVSLGSDYYPIDFSEMAWCDFYGIDISKFFDLALSEYNIAVTGWRQYNGGSNNISDPTNTSIYISYEGHNGDGTEYATIVLMGNSAGDPPEASTEWQYTTSGSTITLTKYIGSDTDVVMHNKYIADGKTYENVTFVEPPQVTEPPSARPFTNTVNGEEITSVTIEKGVKAPSSLRYGLNHHKKLAYADLSGLDVSNVTTTVCMFIYNTALTDLNLSGWNTSNVVNMSEMFSGCASLISLDVSGWNTSKVTNMSYMFSGCSSLTSLDLSSWDLSRLTNAKYMFDGCTNLKTIYVKDSTAYNKLYSLSNVCIPSGCSVIVGSPTSTASLLSLSNLDPASPDDTALAPAPDQEPMAESIPPPVQYTLTISGPSTVKIGYTATLGITKTPEDDATINWTSSDETIATVDEFGVVTGIGTGEVTISAQVGETVCQWVMTVTDIPDVEADLEYRGEGDTPILARYTKELPLAYSRGSYCNYNIKI